MGLLLFMILMLSFTLTFLLRYYALAKNLIDQPNHRSSHVIPTPRGGGIAFVVAFLSAIPCAMYLDVLILPVVMPIISGGIFVALLGFLDDHHGIGTMLRFIGHFIAAIIALFFLGSMPSISFASWSLPTSFFLDSFAVIYLVWLLNLYNFMDGVDGLAGVEALSICLGVVLIDWCCGDFVLIYLPLMLAAGVTGFLVWNFPKACIFMGDVGSGFLGLVFGIMSIQSAMVNSRYFWSWVILLGVFIVDATLTLLLRFFRGDKVYEAHRRHAYQHAAQYFGGHVWVTVGVLILNMVWLLPWAILVALGLVDGVVGALLAYFPLVLLALVFKAGGEFVVQEKYCQK